MKLVILFGPQAVGKMTVGHELEKITNLKLFHNHMTIELVTPFFSYGSETGKRLVNLFREEIFEEVSKSDLPGLIFTYVWAFDLAGDWEYIDRISKKFESRGAEIYYVELEADLEERLERNKTPHRLEHKPTKRNITRSEQDLISTMEKYRLNSHVGEIQKSNYFRINNTNLSANEVAKIIKEKFEL
ncbi:AAA family ATPase [Paenibacillus lutimineralis]|uniref:Shikimate kinase n=1 Tax=Paenibacillus lutimineralis TaxID=2707005 RepID=A0A3S9UXG9_9BACL|nr:AAA family ATPase [Paenibacillus lutimineralis]AZS15016.1 shikimate kinase [Paenibacillus lutimineralis]